MDRKMKAKANKERKRAAGFRTNIKLAKRAGLRWSVIGQMEDDAIHYLANVYDNYPPSHLGIGVTADMSFAEKKQALKIKDGDFENTPEERDFINKLSNGQAEQKRINWIWRIGQESREMALQQWFPFFVTLTVDPSRCNDAKAMWKDGSEFQQYIRRVARIAAKAHGTPSAIKNGASARQFVRYCGVIEHGSSRDHHHLHCLLWMRAIPDEWKRDPNYGILDPKHRINDWCRPLTREWHLSQFGIGRAKYFRHEGDVWSQMGWTLPFDQKKQRTIRVAAPEAAGTYIGKYLDKEIRAWTHRVKATHQIGMTRLKSYLQQVHLKRLEALTWRPSRFPLMTFQMATHSVPPALLRSEAKSMLFARRWVGNTMDWEQEMQPSSDSYGAMLKSVRTGVRPNYLVSAQFYDWVSAHLPVPKGYSERRFKAAHSQLGIEFPVSHTHEVRHIGVA